MPTENDNDDDGGAPFTEKQVESFLQILDQRDKAKQRKADRDKEPKGFGDFLDRVADAVLDRAEERAAARAKAAEGQNDEEPSRGDQDTRSAFRKFWEGS